MALRHSRMALQHCRMALPALEEERVPGLLPNARDATAGAQDPATQR